MSAHQRRFFVDPPGGSGFQQRHFDILEQAEEYAARCPARTRIVDRGVPKGPQPAEPMPPEAPKSANPPNPKQRYGDMKVPLGFVPSASIIYEALALAEGAEKYDPYNWRVTAVEAMTYVHAALRHLHAWVDGEDIDPDSGKPHLGHAKACLGILADATECGRLIDNRPLPASTGELLREWMKTPPDNGTLTMEKVIEAHRILTGDEYPFRHHRTMAEVMAEESRGSAAARQAGAFGEGDETAEATAPPACHHHRLTLRCSICDPKPSRPVWTRDELAKAVRGAAGPIPTPKYEDMQAVEDRHPCDCDRGRCKIENGWGVGSRVFCCQAEAGE